MTKGILKRHSLSGVSVASSNSESADSSFNDDSPKHKRVSFDGAEPAKVFEADEWDRSPAEVTLRLTYKDVVELRELNVSLVRTGHLMMERTPSRRPCRQRTPTSTSTARKESSLADPSHGHFPTENQCDEPVPRPSSPVPSPSVSPVSPTFQSQLLSSPSLPALLEDTTASPPPSPPTELRGRGHSASTSDSYFALCPRSPTGTPPGLSIRASGLKGMPSPVLTPPSPLSLSPSTSLRTPAPRLSLRPASPVPLFLCSKPPPTSPRGKTQCAPESQSSIVLPMLSRRASVSDEIALAAGKNAFSQSMLNRDGPLSTPIPLGFHINSSLQTVSSSKNTLSSTPPTPAVTRRSGKSLIGWDLKRTASGSGKLVFGLVKKGSKEA